VPLQAIALAALDQPGADGENQVLFPLRYMGASLTTRWLTETTRRAGMID
jgi:hypothetical protein